jgi:hypothetical protein
MCGGLSLPRRFHGSSVRAPSLRTVGGNPYSAKSIAEWRSTSTAVLIEQHDEITGQSGSVSTADDYRAELARRDAEQQTLTIVRLTKWIAALTVANVALVAYSVFQ